MATKLGGELPAKLVTKIRSECKQDTNEILILTSVDDTGFPNVSLLSYLDLLVVSKNQLLLAIGANSSTKANLLKRRKGTVMMWVGKDLGMFYVKGRVSLVKERMNTVVEGFICSAIALTVKVVSQDFSPVARILSTLTYDEKRVNASHFELQQELKSLVQ